MTGLVVAALSLTACGEDMESAPDMPAVGSSSDLTAIEGARAGQAEMGIQSLGYQLVRTERLTAFWFNRTTGACARIVRSEGRYSSVTMLPSEGC